ncbi:hypothetical protein J1605_001787 [Eschrichtius robustus]|uniref:Uncharacterized protein n=1 Tax=Eschrichtius robustus TaxID=9764 RepID=A0AB34HY53_ESCRO|nr:hypothetical protein J1605_001787 [Eschrichtius robustus]
MHLLHDSRQRVRDFPGGAVVKNPPANAGDTGSSPGPGRSHMPRSNKARAQLLSQRATVTEACMLQLLSLCAATTEASTPRACARQRESTAMRSLCTTMKSSPRSPQLEKARGKREFQAEEMGKKPSLEGMKQIGLYSKLLEYSSSNGEIGVALRHVGSSWTRARAHVPRIGRRILNHCATREALF